MSVRAAPIDWIAQLNDDIGPLGWSIADLDFIITRVERDFEEARFAWSHAANQYTRLNAILESYQKLRKATGRHDEHAEPKHQRDAVPRHGGIG